MKVDMSTTDSPPTSPDSLKNPSKPDWKISELYEKSWEIIKKNKVLWIFGMAVGVGSGGSSFNSNFDTDSIEKILNNKEKETAGILPNVLGDATDKGSQLFNQLISAIPAPLLLVLGLEVLILVILGLIISFVYGAWANAALIQGIQNAINHGVNGKAVSIRDSSEKAFGSIKPLIWLGILIFLIVFGAVFAFMIPILLVVAINNTVLTVIMVLLAILSVIPLILIFVMTGIWAPLMVILDKKPAWVSLKMGFRLAKKKFWPMLGLGIVNSILAFFVVGIPFIVLTGVVIGVVIGIIWGATQTTNLTLILAPFAAILVLVALVGFMLLSGIVTAFKASVWTIAYNKIRGKYDN